MQAYIEDPFTLRQSCFFVAEAFGPNAFLLWASMWVYMNGKPARTTVLHVESVEILWWKFMMGYKHGSARVAMSASTT